MYADNIRITVEITGVKINGGNVHVGIFTNELDHRNDIPFVTFILESTNSTLVHELELPQGYCLVWAFQDINNNGKLDTGFFGIPNEPVGLTNYSGRGIPGRFNRHKVPVNSTTEKISINLSVIRL
jgi:uncharacterized protein (DUF2141 family)